MEYGSHHQREERDGCLVMRFGCCAPRVDGDEGREALRANGMFSLLYFYFVLLCFPPFMFLSAAVHSFLSTSSPFSASKEVPVTPVSLLSRNLRLA
jgi:hypothetical protein